MRFAIDIRYDGTPIAGTSIETETSETPDTISKRLAESYARDIKLRNVTSFDAVSLIGEVRSFARKAAESGESTRTTITFIDGKPQVTEKVHMGNVLTMAIRDRKPGDKITVHLIALSNDEVVERSRTLERLMA